MATGRLPDPNTAPLTAKGDLYTYSTVPARLAVGSNGDTLVADSSTTTGLRWQADWNTGKNKIINGDFGIWQRGTSFANASDDSFTADRWIFGKDGTATITVSQQTFTPGTAPVSGYEGQFFLRIAPTSYTNGNLILTQRIEDVRTFAGQTVTISFWAKATSSQSNTILYIQNYGSGGSVSNNASAGTVTIGTSWSRHSVTVAIPSISGKTVGTSSYLAIQFLRYAANNTVDIWGVQVQAGSVATPFTTATGTLAGELSACQRYYWRLTGGNGNYAPYAVGFAASATSSDYCLNFPTAMRTNPTVVEYSTLAISDGVSVYGVTSVTLVYSNTNKAYILAGVSSGLTTYRPYILVNNNNSTTAHLAISAEL